MSVLLSIDALNAHHGQLPAVRNVSLQVRQGDILALVGVNGAGKTTLLRTLAGAHRASSGTVRWEGVDITRMPAHQRVSEGLALVPEGRRLFAGMTVRENLLVARAAGRRGQWSFDTVLDAFPQLAPKLNAKAGELSGGQQQAVAIGRALMTNPKMVLLDEPSMGLAPILVDQIFEIIQGLHKDGVTILLVEQNAQMALSVADRGYVLETGRIVTEGTGAALLESDAIKKAYLGG